MALPCPGGSALVELPYYIESVLDRSDGPDHIRSTQQATHGRTQGNNAMNYADRFSVVEAQQASQNNDPIMMTERATYRLCRQHGMCISNYINEQRNGHPSSTYDAWDVLSWLGY